ncbi:4'-phosphopantetheinyl transferase superfamily protein [Marinifilum caeruleilacunae]|uniref:4'-phosphopantetheinyl transferase superfamily protein n=1 Tax=Marinifilum caeruleilacunae TaxID=2499076 RepID=A0ABX1WZC9_9BACT|nr:4'-phosphopantetheinyl transferase superfamily protein [Marinifilum caeruleilacunae]NOU61481.1 4'-phosphopantetheinyl transferase superfamily protein [Marinifilum caeruleilacunae]
MPFSKHLEICEGCNLYIWKIEEEVDVLKNLVKLSEKEKVKYDSFKSESRKKEYLATRLLVQKYIGSNLIIENNEHGRPFLLNSDLNISISHTKNFAAIFVCKDAKPALDMEYLSDRVHRIARRFLSETEVKNISKDHKTLHLYQHWCAKECLIKFYGKKDVHLIDELKIHPFQAGQESFTGEVCRKDFSKTYTFKHILFDGYLLVYAVDFGKH